MIRFNGVIILPENNQKDLALNLNDLEDVSRGEGTEDLTIDYTNLLYK